MNILFTSPTPFHPLKGGVGRVTDTLCKQFLKRGHNVFYLHKSWHCKENKEFAYPAPVYILPNTNYTSLENIEYYHNFLRHNQIDIVINQDGLYDGSYLFLNTGNNKVKTISVIHNNPLRNLDYLWYDLSTLHSSNIEEYLRRIARCLLYYKVKNRIRKDLKFHYRFLFDNSDMITLLSSFYFPSLLHFSPFIEKKLKYINNPNSFEDQKLIPNKDKEIIYVGRLDNSSKRVDRLLIIWKMVFRQHSDWKLSIVGDGPDREFLERLSDKLCLENLEFCGFKESSSFYRKASIICMTSNYEGFPMVLTEAMQFGCVPIAFDSFAAIHDVINDHNTGILIKPFDLKSYARQLSLLMDNEDYRTKLSVEAFKHVKLFNIENIIEQWEEAFHQLKKS